MTLILAILFTMDGKPMRDWKLPIQPNSLIAVSSTIAKSALLVPLAECIGQLKWIYFHTPNRSLSTASKISTWLPVDLGELLPFFTSCD